MRIVTNYRLIRRNRRTAQYIFFFSLAILILGFITINAPLVVQDLPGELLPLLSFILPIIILPLAFVTTVVSVRMTNLWVRQPRPEAELEANIKGLGKDAVLYSYFHFPARHVLICPQGVFAIVTRFQDGKHSVEGDRWRSQRGLVSRILSAFRMDGLRNPSLDAVLAAEHVQKLIDPIAPDVEVQPIVLFTDPRAKVEIVQPTVPVLRAQTRIQPSFQDFLKKYPKEGRTTLTPEQTAAFEAASLPEHQETL